MSLAAKTREAVRADPVLYDALCAGIVNYTAAADSLAIDGDREAIATALRRFAAGLDTDGSTDGRSITVRLHSDLDTVDAPDCLLAVDGTGIAVSGDAVDGHLTTESDGQTALRVTGDVDARLLSSTLDQLRITEIPVVAAGVTDQAMVILVPRREGPTAVQVVESVAAST